jgi:hypothetical protein
MLPSPFLLVPLLRRALAIVRPLNLGFCRPLAAPAKHFRAVQMAELSHRAELGRLAFHLYWAAAKCVLYLPRGLSLRPDAVAHPACLFHAQLVTETRLTREPASHPAQHDRPCHLEEAHPPDPDLRRLGSFLDPAPGCLPRERQHELAVEFSSDLPI